MSVVIYLILFRLTTCVRLVGLPCYINH